MSVSGENPHWVWTGLTAGYWSNQDFQFMSGVNPNVLDLLSCTLKCDYFSPSSYDAALWILHLNQITPNLRTITRWWCVKKWHAICSSSHEITSCLWVLLFCHKEGIRLPFSLFCWAPLAAFLSSFNLPSCCLSPNLCPSAPAPPSASPSSPFTTDVFHSLHPAEFHSCLQPFSCCSSLPVGLILTPQGSHCCVSRLNKAW